ncbi:uncharacterized protein [Pocillopora verrucosa]|uniref:uncharacterized protein n=1 Tax=Pocillopora verrucosa TaxID=203993 RepID=UPI00333E517F
MASISPKFIHEALQSLQMEIVTNVADDPDILNIIDITRYSTLVHLLRVTARVINFARKWRKRKVYSETFTAKDIVEARNVLLKATQHKIYRQEISYLKNKDKSRQPAIIRQFDLYLDDEDIIRCRGRLRYTDLPHDTKFPILIPKDNYLTTFIVHSMHKQVMHGGVRETFTHIRQTYWIPQGRQLVKRIISKCVTCRKVEGPPFRSVPTPPLPQSRVQQSLVFQFTGIDHARPLYVCDQTNQTSSKMYICLFTCAVVRAIHLELVEDQTTDAFLRAFRRFISRRGVPECIISDNAKTFKAGAQELQTIKTQILGTGSSQQFLAHHNITWKFITERAPWWGGFYERLIGLMKRCLKKTLGKACLNMIELNTILTEVEAVLNSRPLTYPYTDINDASLTPSHFLCGYRLLTLPDTNAKENEADPDYIPSEMSTKALTKRAQYQKTLIKAFWTRWKTEYLTSLREHHTCRKRILNKKAVAIGDVVLIHDNTPRNQWKIDVVTSLHTGKDGLARSVSLRVPSITTYRETLSVRDVRHTD